MPGSPPRDADIPAPTPDTQGLSTNSPSAPGSETKRRIRRPVVIAGLEFTPEQMWQWWLRILQKPAAPPEPRLFVAAVMSIADTVRRKGLRFVMVGETRDTTRFVLVTQSKGFPEGYLGMPEEEIPLYPKEEGKYEQRARRLLREILGIQNADELPYVTFLTGENPELY